MGRRNTKPDAVLHQLGASVRIVDHADPAPEILRLPGVTFRRGNAFAILPDEDSRFAWIFCDVACYLEKLLDWVYIGLNSGKCHNFVFTVEFQGNSHYGVSRNLPLFRILHLSIYHTTNTN
jgi:23S rRNA (cytidine2498-2'-O)-methyltransferase